MEENSPNTDASSRQTSTRESNIDVILRPGHLELANNDIMEETYDSRLPTNGGSSYDIDTGNSENESNVDVPEETDEVNYIFVLTMFHLYKFKFIYDKLYFW